MRSNLKLVINNPQKKIEQKQFFEKNELKIILENKLKEKKTSDWVKGMEELLEIYSSFLPIDRLRYSLWLIFVASSTLYFIHEWKLTKDRETSMKKEAIATIEEESYFLLNS